MSITGLNCAGDEFASTRVKLSTDLLAVTGSNSSGRAALHSRRKFFRLAPILQRGNPFLDHSCGVHGRAWHVLGSTSGGQRLLQDAVM